MNARDGKRGIFVFLSLVKDIFLGKFSRRRCPLPENAVNENYSSGQREELERLCRRIFEKRHLVTSGRLRLIGLGNIKKSMGEAWEGLRPLVHDIAARAIRKHLSGGDIFFRYRDDTYIVIFAEASRGEGGIKTARIADEIREGLFAAPGGSFRNIEIEGDVRVLETEAWAAQSTSEMLETICAEPDELSVLPQKERTFFPPKHHCTYLPLWDTQKKALTAYLCLPADTDAGKKMSRSERAAVDMNLLDAAIAELEQLDHAGKKFFIICPVRHETLYNQDSYKKYHMLCQRVPPEQRKSLILLMTHLLKDLPKTQVCWFALTLKNYCHRIFAEVPLGQKTDFLTLRNAGIDALGVRLDGGEAPEQETIRLLNSFTGQARAQRIAGTFALGVSTLSLATSTVCAGFDYLGGAAIHEPVGKPDTVYRYGHEDLFAPLLESGGT